MGGYPRAGSSPASASWKDGTRVGYNESPPVSLPEPDMTWHFRFALCGALLFAMICGGDEPTSEQISFFEKRVRPVLVERCQDSSVAPCKGMGAIRLDLLQWLEQDAGFADAWSHYARRSGRTLRPTYGAAKEKATSVADARTACHIPCARREARKFFQSAGRLLDRLRQRCRLRFASPSTRATTS